MLKSSKIKLRDSALMGVTVPPLFQRGYVTLSLRGNDLPAALLRQAGTTEAIP
jgi:hypothetical protein